MKEKIKEFVPIIFLDFLRRWRDIKLYSQLRMAYIDERRLRSILVAVRSFVLPKKLILFYPERPARAFIEYKVCAILGYTITDRLRSNADIVVRRENTTLSREYPELLKIKNSMKFNMGELDISKANVERVFEKVFNYSLAIDPMVYRGLAVQKSDKNYAHDGKVIRCPIEQKLESKGYVFEKLVDNRIDEIHVEDIRVPVVGGTIPIVQKKIRPMLDRFSNNNTEVKVVIPNEELSPREQSFLLTFVNRMGLNYCELDVLRDRGNGKIYVVDCNSTPAFGPPPGMAVEEQKKYLHAVSQAFNEMFFPTKEKLI